MTRTARRSAILAITAALAGGLAFAGPRPADVAFKVTLIDPGYNETAAVADLNKDGKLDIISGDSWYQAPTWTKHHLRDINFQSNYIDNFTDIPMDVDGDGWTDIVQFAYFSQNIVWLKNPGRAGGDWKVAEIAHDGRTEFGFAVDMTGDGTADDLLPEYDQNNLPLSWYEHVKGGFVKHTVSPVSYGHGIGAGDMNGDGHNDILTPQGWLEAPADPRAAGAWVFHPVDWATHPIAPAGGVAPGGPVAQTSPGPNGTRLVQFGWMSLIDVNGDGRKDLIAAAAHDYGLAWYEQTADGRWVQHVIDNTWSQAHAMAWGDINGDGKPDYITGKRYFAHNGTDPGEREPIGLYWYEYRPNAAGNGVEWIRHILDYGGRMGGGMQIVPVDIDGDGDIDVVSGGKAGLSLAINQTKSPR